LEATGRSGSDDGFDARGIEAVYDPSNDLTDNEDGGEVEEIPPPQRTWLIQCKREKAIAAKKIAGYMDALTTMLQDGVYGIIFAAACDFSKATRDIFFQKARELGLAEAHLWGKAEIEDMLFQPRNDRLLFAYFGVSLLSRQRTMRTEVRSRLAAKRKAKRIVKDQSNVLVRDASDDRYPYLDPDVGKTRLHRGRWKLLQFEGYFSDGLHFKVASHMAWVSADGTAWDFAEAVNDASPLFFEDPWRADDDGIQQQRAALLDYWYALPDNERGRFEIEAVLPYENIIDIDEHGDEFFEGAHIYTVEFVERSGPFSHTPGAQQQMLPGRLDQLSPDRLFGLYLFGIDDGAPPPRPDKPWPMPPSNPAPAPILPASCAGTVCSWPRAIRSIRSTSTRKARRAAELARQICFDIDLMTPLTR
jgi:hypothetical protein